MFEFTFFSTDKKTSATFIRQLLDCRDESTKGETRRSTCHFEKKVVPTPLSCVPPPHILPLCENWDPKNWGRRKSCNYMLLAIAVLTWLYSELVFGTRTRRWIRVRPHEPMLNQLTSARIPCLAWQLTSLQTPHSSLWTALCPCCAPTVQLNDAARGGVRCMTTRLWPLSLAITVFCTTYCTAVYRNVNICSSIFVYSVNHYTSSLTLDRGKRGESERVKGERIEGAVQWRTYRWSWADGPTWLSWVRL